jgi:hypothetical protein
MDSAVSDYSQLCGKFKELRAAPHLCWQRVGAELDSYIEGEMKRMGMRGASLSDPPQYNKLRKREQDSFSSDPDDGVDFDLLAKSLVAGV